MTSLRLLNNLDSNQIEFFKKFSEVHLFKTLTQVIYKGQIPMAAYVLLKGKITFKDSKNKVVSECSPTSLIGFSEIFEGKFFKYTVEISADSEVLILPQSTIFEIQKECEELNICPHKNLSKLSSIAV